MLVISNSITNLRSNLTVHYNWIIFHINERYESIYIPRYNSQNHEEYKNSELWKLNECAVFWLQKKPQVTNLDKYIPHYVLKIRKLNEKIKWV